MIWLFILFAKAMEDKYPNHVTLAVCFPDEQHGDYVTYDGKPYFVCDPTFLNAKSGMLPAALKNSSPTLLLLE